MRSAVSRFVFAAMLIAGTARPADSRLFHFHVAGDEPGPWPAILSSLGLVPGTQGVYVVGSAAVDAEPWRARIQEGAVVVVEGDSPLAASYGIVPDPAKRFPVRSVIDENNPGMEIVWQRAVDLPRYRLPAEASVYARERWNGIPLAAGLRRGKGAVLWLAVSPGEGGHERFPYLPQMLGDLGVSAPLRSRGLWAFFDWSYRARADLDYLARRWRTAGIAALHVAAWHFYDRDAGRDAFLERLIEACHREAITVYAWVELPHVSDAFWDQHPEWRERTAAGQDAHLDWRRLMNLNDPDCEKAVAAGMEDLLTRFDWDGVNLAELYFESLEGAANAARFTPMNEDTRAAFEREHHFDPAVLFDPASPRHQSRDQAALNLFLDWRARLAQRMQEDWIARMERIRTRRPDLALVLTHVDDRYDTRMRDLVGADAARLLPLLNKHDFTFLVEDPATIWHLGPERYPDIAAKYRPITPRPAKLAIDINVVERYQDVYPTKQQTGLELFRLVHLASRAFPRVALYFENSILPVDLPWLASAAATPDRIAFAGGKIAVESSRELGVPFEGPVLVNGQTWPHSDGVTVWLPAGKHAIEAAPKPPPLSLVDFSAEVRTLAATRDGFELAYASDSTAWAVLDRKPAGMEIDGEPLRAFVVASGGRWLVRLPRGQHLWSAAAGG
ncbi:MAG: hypothetical protein R2762_05695 [Bryobacteraceae bacterium]